jgi:hypothetical protein
VTSSKPRAATNYCLTVNVLSFVRIITFSVNFSLKGMAKHLKIKVTLSKYTPAAEAQTKIPVPFEVVPLFLLTLTTVL